MRPPHDCFDESCCASVFAWTFKNTESCCAPVLRCDNQQDLACMQSGLIRLIYKHQIRLMVIMSIPLKVAQHYALHANTHNLHALDTSCCHHVHTTSDICMGTRSLSLSSCPFHIKLINTSLYEQTRTICRRQILLTVIMSTPLLTSAGASDTSHCHHVHSYAFQPKTERETLPDHLLRGSGASWDRFDKGMATPPESCSKPRPSAFRKTGLHPCVFKPQTTRRWEPRRTHPPHTPSKHQKNWGAAWCLSPIRVF